MNAAIITVAGISSRFNADVPEREKTLKAIYTAFSPKETLLYQLVRKCAFADRIIVVGGYQFEQLQKFIREVCLPLWPQLVLVENPRYADLSSGYSLYLGITEALKHRPDRVLFVEGDLDIDDMSFEKVVRSGKNVLTYTKDPVYARKSVALYQKGDGRYQYAFNSAHGLLSIPEPFSMICNSGQLWQFTDAAALKTANDTFFRDNINDTNLGIIQGYLDRVEPDSVELIRLDRWTNCNTRDDYNHICTFWRETV